MIINNPVIRLVLKAISACGLIDSQSGSAARHGNRDEQGDSPFVLVGRAADGTWGVFQRNFDKPLVTFDELHKACDYANELAGTRAGSIVLMGRTRDSTANRDSSIAQGTT